MHRRRFSISTLLLLTAIVCMAISWYIDHVNGGKPSEQYIIWKIERAIANEISPSEIEEFIGMESARFGDKFDLGMRQAHELKPDPGFPDLPFPILGRRIDNNAKAYAIWRIWDESTGGHDKYIGICWPQDGAKPYMFRAVYIPDFPLCFDLLLHSNYGITN